MTQAEMGITRYPVVAPYGDLDLNQHRGSLYLVAG